MRFQSNKKQRLSIQTKKWPKVNDETYESSFDNSVVGLPAIGR